MELMIPLLRADFQMIQTYDYQAEPPLECPITVYGGLQDREAPRRLLQPWEEQTNSGFALRMLQGDHFFIRSCQTVLLGLLARELSKIIACSQINGAQT